MLPTLYYYIYTATRPHLLKSKWKYWHHLTHASKLLFHLTFEFGIVIERILVQQSVPKYFFHRFYAGIQEKYSRIAPIAVWPKLGGKGGGWPIKGSQSNFKFKDFWSICQPFPFVGMKFVWYLIVQIFVWFLRSLKIFQDRRIVQFFVIDLVSLPLQLFCTSKLLLGNVLPWFLWKSHDLMRSQQINRCKLYVR